ncbi:MAG TPA: Na+/H+ antiporter NhaC family protein [Symbiobacteriaceae bacterium]|nr:Na+/H+ antiporter NhaC family protein [Symbiobacteriaceae bacterium]
MSQRFGLGEAALPLVTAVVLMGATIVAGSTDLYWPLLAGLIVALVLAARKGFGWSELRAAAVGGVKATWIPVFILILVGCLIGVWKLSGTVPAMVYYGLSVASPRFLVPTAFVLSLTMAMLLGTSVGTYSTLGVAIMGVAHGVGAPLPMVAGALVSGALFGDRSSPLAGSLNLNVAMTGTDLRKMLPVLAPTGITAAVLTLVGYLVFGVGPAGAGASAGAGMREAISNHFVINPWLLVPPILVLGLAFMRVPVKWALGLGIVAGGVLSVVVAGTSILQPVKAALFGYLSNAGDPALDKVFSGGGLFPMWRQFALLWAAGAFSGIMEKTGMMSVVFDRLVEGTRRPLALVGSAMMVSTGVALVAANQALPIIITGRMLRPIYDKAGYSPELLSRSIADSATVLSGIIPWNLMAMLAAAALGVPVRAFVPFAFFAFLLPMVSLVFAYVEERRGLAVFARAAADLTKAD